jgi:hypothetical protein
VRWLVDLIDRAIGAAYFLFRVGLVLLALWLTVGTLFWGEGGGLERLILAGMFAYAGWLWWVGTDET